MNQNNIADMQNKNDLEKNQSYKCKDTIINVEPVFKKSGKKTLFHSLGMMIHKETHGS